MSYQKHKELLQKLFEQGGLAHAYVFSGHDMAGIAQFTKEFILHINDKAYWPMIEQGGFPDLFVVKSGNSDSSQKNEKDMMEIDVAQIRDAQNFLAYRSYYSGIKTVVVEHADRMNTEAQSCFLKTLEEPKGQTLIILQTAKPDALLQTIFSRCQQIKFISSNESELLPQEQAMLAQVQKLIGADLATKFQYTKNVNLENGSFDTMMAALQKHFRVLLLKEVAGEGSGKYPIEKLKKILETISDIQHQVAFQNANPKLALEVLLMEI